MGVWIEWFLKNFLLVLIIGVLMGFVFLVCECGNVFVVCCLLVSGVLMGMVFGFLFVVLVLNFIVLVSIWVVFFD